MILIGCTPPDRHTEQHDVFFGVGQNLYQLKQDIIDFWPEANGEVHIDAWREVTNVDGYKISIVNRQEKITADSDKLFFINMGGYKQNEFEEFHYKMITVAANKGSAIQQAKQTAFYKHTGFKGAESHIDDKYGIDVDDIYNIEDILPQAVKEKYTINLVKEFPGKEDEMNLGYIKLNKLLAFS
jgi:hypothetical protein